MAGDVPPSLEALQATRPGDEQGDGLETDRAEILRESGLTHGAQGGLAGRSFAINEMLRRYEAELTTTYDFRALVLPVGGGQTMMRPPIESANAKALNAPRTLLVTAANTVAVLCLAVAGGVRWPEALLGRAGAVCGGYSGAHLGRRPPPGRVRAGTIAMPACFFLRAYG